MATGMVQRADGSWFYEDTSPAHLTYDQWLAQQGGPGATPPGPAMVVPAQSDFSIAPAPSVPQAPAPEQEPVNAKAYYRSQGQDYNPEGGSPYKTYSSDPSGLTPEDRDAADEWSKDFDEVKDEPWKPGKLPKGPTGKPAQAPQSQPYQPPEFNYGFDSPSYGGMGAASDSKEVWGASYGGVGEDPYLKSMKSFSQPFKQYFSQMQLDHF